MIVIPFISHLDQSLVKPSLVGTAFVTAYETFGAGHRFAEILLYQGQVAAAGLKDI